MVLYRIHGYGACQMDKAPTPLRDMPERFHRPPYGEPLDLDVAGDALYYETDSGLAAVEHPLYKQLFYVPEIMNEYINRAIPAKREWIIQSVRKYKWLRVIFTYERPFRTNVLWTLYLWSGDYSDYTYDPLPGFPEGHPIQKEAYDRWLTTCDRWPRYFWQLARNVWVDNENIHQNVIEWNELWFDSEGSSWMENEDRQRLSDIAYNRKPLMLYRGECEDGGWSWSLNRKVGEFFARRGINNATGEVRVAEVPQDLVFCYFGGRGEEEIIVLEDLTPYEIERYRVKNEG